MENGILWLIVSNVGTAILFLVVGYFVAKHNFEKEQLSRELNSKNAEMWTKMIEKIGGEKCQTL